MNADMYQRPALGFVPEWHDRALCAQTDPEEFFPDRGGSTRQAKRVCRNCEVRAECLEYALAAAEEWGIWGGLSAQERRAVARLGAPRPLAGVGSQPAHPALRPARDDSPRPALAPEPEPEPEDPERCEKCGYLKTAPGHKLTCENV